MLKEHRANVLLGRVIALENVFRDIVTEASRQRSQAIASNTRDSRSAVAHSLEGTMRDDWMERGVMETLWRIEDTRCKALPGWDEPRVRGPFQ